MHTQPKSPPEAARNSTRIDWLNHPANRVTLCNLLARLLDVNSISITEAYTSSMSRVFRVLISNRDGSQQEAILKLVPLLAEESVRKAFSTETQLYSELASLPDGIPAFPKLRLAPGLPITIPSSSNPDEVSAVFRYAIYEYRGKALNKFEESPYEKFYAYQQLASQLDYLFSKDIYPLDLRDANATCDRQGATWVDLGGSMDPTHLDRAPIVADSVPIYEFSLARKLAQALIKSGDFTSEPVRKYLQAARVHAMRSFAVQLMTNLIGPHSMYANSQYYQERKRSGADRNELADLKENMMMGLSNLPGKGVYDLLEPETVLDLMGQTLGIEGLATTSSPFLELQHWIEKYLIHTDAYSTGSECAKLMVNEFIELAETILGYIATY